MKALSILASSLILLMIALPGSGAHDEQAETIEFESDDQQCLRIRSIDNYKVINDENLYVETRPDGKFVLSFSRRCRGLDSAKSLTFYDEMNRMCTNGFSTVNFVSRGSPGKCRVRTVTKVLDWEDALARFSLLK